MSWGMMAAAIAAGLSAVGAAYAVAHVGSAAVGALAEKPELLGRGLRRQRLPGFSQILRPLLQRHRHQRRSHRHRRRHPLKSASCT